MPTKIKKSGKLLFLWVGLMTLALLQPAAAYKNDIGYTQLTLELGAAMPTGAGVLATQVEAPDSNGRYRPSAANAEFTGKTFTALSGDPTGSSTHATTVGRYFYGTTTSVAPGITNIHNYEANNWLGAGFLRTTDPTVGPMTTDRDIINHSWVGSSSSAGYITLVTDYSIRQSNYVSVVGVGNNGNNSALLSSSYHSISVGLTNGTHGHANTTVPTAGRARPHVVAPGTFTSYATPIVSATAALLIETGRNTLIIPAPDTAAATDFRTIKSIIMAGATKSQFPAWSNTSTSPLDNTYGAGQVNVYNSYHILAAARQASSLSSDVTAWGWDFNAVSSMNARPYFLDLDMGGIHDITLSLNWAVEIQPAGSVAEPWASINFALPNLYLQIYEADNYSLVGGPIYESVSTIENLQYIYADGLSGGRYAIVVSTPSGAPIDYSLAWMTTTVQIVPEPSAGWLIMIGLAMCWRIKKRRSADGVLPAC